MNHTLYHRRCVCHWPGECGGGQCQATRVPFSSGGLYLAAQRCHHSACWGVHARSTSSHPTAHSKASKPTHTKSRTCCLQARLLGGNLLRLRVRNSAGLAQDLCLARPYSRPKVFKHGVNLGFRCGVPARRSISHAMRVNPFVLDLRRVLHLPTPNNVGAGAQNTSRIGILAPFSKGERCYNV